MDLNKLNRTSEVLDILGEIEYHFLRLHTKGKGRACCDAYGQYSNGTDDPPYPKVGHGYPCGPCPGDGPVTCYCGTVVTDDNVKYYTCPEECDVCRYCSQRRCPSCGAHMCCGGCV